jgi:hypothetical protein
VAFTWVLSCGGTEHPNAAVAHTARDARAAIVGSSVPSGGLERVVRRCNGRADLCARAYDRVVFPATHNAHAAREYGYSAIGNQLGGLAAQLNDGVRAFLVDVYYDAIGRRVFCHGFCGLASTRHRDGLAVVKTFLDAHPNEVLTFIYENHVRPRDLAADFEAGGLGGSAFTKRRGEPWPTLGQMIDAGTRIVIATESRGAGPEWVHSMWDLGFDTKYGLAELDCQPNRGSVKNGLFLLNHWVNALGLPSETNARAVNGFENVYRRASRCARDTTHVPNYVAVDFYEHGDLFAAVDQLNDDVSRGLL